MVKKWFKRNPIHSHDWELVAVNDEYHSKYSDTGETKYWQMRFYKCECGDRKFSDNRNNEYIRHVGMQTAKENWIDSGVVPAKSYHPKDNKHYVHIDDVVKEELDPILAYQKTLDDLSKSLQVVLNRDFNLESKYPELKKAADEYHRKLDKYRNFESLKEK